MVPAAGFEPATYGLQNRCTTTVLSRQFNDLHQRVSAAVSTTGKSALRRGRPPFYLGPGTACECAAETYISPVSAVRIKGSFGGVG